MVVVRGEATRRTAHAADPVVDAVRSSGVSLLTAGSFTLSRN